MFRLVLALALIALAVVVVDAVVDADADCEESFLASASRSDSLGEDQGTNERI